MDAITFDGSCTPNPGGCMGLGWTVTLQNNSFSILGNDRLGRNNSNSALFAEYLALKKGILEYIKADGQGPLTVIGDSQTVINQLRGIYPIENSDVERIHKDIGWIIRENELDVYYRWVPRAQNQKADKLSKSKRRIHIKYPNERKYLIDVENAPVSGKLKQKISAMNSTPFPSTGMFRKLHTGSKDLLSDKHLDELELMAGEYAAKIVTKEFSGKSNRKRYYRAQALRWMLRGLAMDLAVQKVRFDMMSKKRSVTGKKKQNGKKLKSIGGRSKYYVNRRTFAF